MLDEEDKKEICRMIAEMAYESYIIVPKTVLTGFDRNHIYRKCLELWGVRNEASEDSGSGGAEERG